MVSLSLQVWHVEAPREVQHWHELSLSIHVPLRLSVPLSVWVTFKATVNTLVCANGWRQVLLKPLGSLLSSLCLWEISIIPVLKCHRVPYGTETARADAFRASPASNIKTVSPPPQPHTHSYTHTLFSTHNPLTVSLTATLRHPTQNWRWLTDF